MKILRRKERKVIRVETHRSNGSLVKSQQWVATANPTSGIICVSVLIGFFIYSVKAFSSLTHTLTIQIISHPLSALRPPPGHLTGRYSVPLSHNQPRPG